MSDIANAFTFFQEANGIMKDIRSEIAVSQYTTNIPIGSIHEISRVQHVKCAAIWDTGATGSVITRKIADSLSLQEVTKIPVSSAAGFYDAGVFVVNLWLPNGAMVPQLYVTEGFLSNDIDVLIGMDVITRGDFTVTNYNGKTCFSYRCPSCERTNYRKQTLSERIHIMKKNGVNSICPCGSGKKAKNCCLPRYEEELIQYRDD